MIFLRKHKVNIKKKQKENQPGECHDIEFNYC